MAAIEIIGAYRRLSCAVIRLCAVPKRIRGEAECGEDIVREAGDESDDAASSHADEVLGSLAGSAKPPRYACANLHDTFTLLHSVGIDRYSQSTRNRHKGSLPLSGPH